MSTAFKLGEVGESDLIPLKMFIRTRKIVMISPIRPGTISGLIKNDTHDTNTNKIDVKYA